MAWWIWLLAVIYVAGWAWGFRWVFSIAENPKKSAGRFLVIFLVACALGAFWPFYPVSWLVQRIRNERARIMVDDAVMLLFMAGGSMLMDYIRQNQFLWWKYLLFATCVFLGMTLVRYLQKRWQVKKQLAESQFILCPKSRQASEQSESRG